MQKVSDPFDLPVKNVKSRTTAKVSVFVLHIVNKRSNHPKTKAWHIIFIIQWIYTRGQLFTEKLPWKILHCFHKHEHKCSRSTLTSSMHNFPITSLFEKLFRHERQVNFLYFNFFCMFHPQLNRNKKEKQNLLSEESKQAHTRISTPRYCSPATAPEKSLRIPKCRESS